jgi:hypothetical protein
MPGNGSGPGTDATPEPTEKIFSPDRRYSPKGFRGLPAG